MKGICIILIALFFVGCNSHDNCQGVQDVIGFYGGKGNCSKGNSGKGKFFELKLSESDRLKDHKDLKIATANMAYMIYTSLSETEKDHLEFIRVIIENGAQKANEEYSIKNLEYFVESTKKLNNTLGYILGEDFETLNKMVSPGAVGHDHLTTVSKTIHEKNSQFGRPKKFKINGFKVNEVNKKDIVSIYGELVRDDVKNPSDFTLTLDPIGTDQYIYDVSASSTL
ncbi:MAG: hypothetical protein ACRCVT_04850 [Leadbetterella sp.]